MRRREVGCQHDARAIHDGKSTEKTHQALADFHSQLKEFDAELVPDKFMQDIAEVSSLQPMSTATNAGDAKGKQVLKQGDSKSDGSQAN